MANSTTRWSEPRHPRVALCPVTVPGPPVVGLTALGIPPQSPVKGGVHEKSSPALPRHLPYSQASPIIPPGQAPAPLGAFIPPCPRPKTH